MKNDDLFELIGEIDDEKIAKAENADLKGNRIWLKFGVFAACFVLIIGVSFSFMMDNMITEKNDVTSTENSEKDFVIVSDEIHKYTYRNSITVQQEEKQSFNLVINDAGYVEIERKDPIYTHYSKLPATLWEEITGDFYNATTIEFSNFIRRIPGKWNEPEFKTFEWLNGEEHKCVEYIFDYGFYGEKGRLTIRISEYGAPTTGICDMLGKFGKEISSINDTDVIAYKIDYFGYDKYLASFEFEGAFYEIETIDVSEEFFSEVLEWLTIPLDSDYVPCEIPLDDSIDNTIEASADVNGNYAEAINTDMLSEFATNIYCGSYLDENGDYVVLIIDDEEYLKKELLYEIGRTNENTVFKTAKYTMNYLEDLQEKISTAMSEKEIPFVVSSGIYDRENRIIVTVNTKDQVLYEKIYSMDTLGGAIEIVYSDEQFTTSAEIAEADTESEIQYEQEIFPEEAIE